MPASSSIASSARASVWAQLDRDAYMRLAVIVAVGLAAHAVLLFSFPYTPILDWPNHLARHFMQAEALLGRPIPDGYELTFEISPNLGGDLVMPWLLLIFPLEVGSIVFLCASVVIFWLGTYLLLSTQTASRAHALALSTLAVPFLINSSFFWGFMNYHSGVGVALVVAWNYFRLAEAPERRTWAALALHGGLVALLYAWHLAAFGAYLVIQGSHGLIAAWSERRGLLRFDAAWRRLFWMAALILPAIALAVFERVAFGPSAFVGGGSYSDLWRKIRNLAAPFGSYDARIDAVLIAVWAGALLAMARVERLRGARFGWPHLAFAFFALFYLILPRQLGTSWGIDLRMIPPLFIMGLIVLARLPARHLVLGAAMALGVTLVRLGVVASAWTGYDAQARAHIAFIEQIEPGAQILSVTGSQLSRLDPFTQVASWAVPLRGASVSSLFALAGQQPLQSTLHDPDAADVSDAGVVFDPARVEGRYDYVWLYDLSGVPAVVQPGWALVHQLGAVSVWRIDAPEG